MSDPRVPALNALRAFEAAARHPTLSRAADELCVTPSAVGHQIRSIEDVLGVQLYERDGRFRRLTAKGERFASELKQAFGQIETACRTLTRPSSAELHINVTPTFAIRWLVPRLGRFQARHPDISVNITTSAAPISLERELIDAALRFGFPSWPGLAADLVFMEDIFPVCRPDLLGGGRVDPRALHGKTLLHSSHRRSDWARWLEAAGLSDGEVDPSRGPVFDLTTMALEAAESGLGVAITREAQVAGSLRDGKLVAPFRRDLLRGEGCYLLTRPERRDDPNIAAFRDWLMDEVLTLPDALDA